MRKIKLAYFGLLLILVGIVSLAFYAQRILEKDGNQSFSDFRNLEYALKINAIAEKEAVYTRNFLISGREDDLLNVIESQKDIREWKIRLSQSVVTPRGQELLAEIVKLEEEEQRAINHSIAVWKTNSSPKALLRYFDDEVGPRYLALQNGINLFVDYKKSVLQAQQRQHKVNSSRLIQFSAWVGGLALVAGLFLVLFMTKMLGRVRKVEEDLRNTIRSRDEFLSIASHDLRTPLTALLIQLQLMGRSFPEWLDQVRSGAVDMDLSSGKLIKAVDRCELQGKRLVKIIDDLFDLTRIRVGQLALSPKAVDLSTVVAEVIARYPLETLPNKRGISFTPNEPVFGFWDPARLDQVVANLISNAVKYGEGKLISIRIEADREHQSAKLFVEDRGAGIVPEMREKIFDRFERAVTDDQVKGLGLGLYIVSQIVKAHGGSIRVESELGKGSTFIVELPMLSKVSECDLSGTPFLTHIDPSSQLQGTNDSSRGRSVPL